MNLHLYCIAASVFSHFLLIPLHIIYPPTLLWPHLWILKELYTGSLASEDFSGAVFTRVHFQKIAQISSLCDFHYISEGIPSLMRFWLLMTYVLRIWFTHKLRTRCIIELLHNPNDSSVSMSFYVYQSRDSCKSLLLLLSPSYSFPVWCIFRKIQFTKKENNLGIYKV